MPETAHVEGVEEAETPSVSNQIVANIGLYYVCYRLSCRGWNVMPTARNAKGIDALIYNQDCSRTFGVQVKALSKRSPVPLGTNLDRLIGDFFIVCRNVNQEPECFILTPEEVRELAHRGEKDGKVSFWLQPKQYSLPQFKDAWERIGTGV